MFRIRLATEEDHLAIIDFQLKMAKESEGVDLELDKITYGVQAVFRDPQKGKYFVVENNNSVIASMLITYEWSDWRNQFVYWLQSVYVIPEFRGRGIFRLMFEHIKELSEKDTSSAGVRLYVDTTNENALKVYKAVGMDGDHYRTFEWMKDE